MTSLVHSGQEAVVPTARAEKPAAHTQGPWEVMRVDDVLAIMPDPITGRADTFLGIATVQEHDGERSARRVEANARLIAAAPDLLEALVAHLEINKRHMLREGFSFEQIDCSTTQARAAIAKATGEATA